MIMVPCQNAVFLQTSTFNAKRRFTQMFIFLTIPRKVASLDSIISKTTFVANLFLGEMYMLDVYLFQQTALTSLKGRQLRIFSDAVSDDRFNASHEYSTAEGFPQTILNIAVDRWSGQGFIIARIRNCDLWLYSARQTWSKFA